MFEYNTKKSFAPRRATFFFLISSLCVFLTVAGCQVNEDGTTEDLINISFVSQAVDLNLSLAQAPGLVAYTRLFTEPTRSTIDAITKRDSGAGQTFQAGASKVDLGVDYLKLFGTVTGGLTGDIPLAGFNRRAILLTNILAEVSNPGQSQHHHFFSKSDGSYPDNGAMARAVVIVAGTERYAFVNADLIGTTQDLYDTVYQKLSTHATVGGNYTDRNQLFLFSTHTHSGPGAFATRPIWKFGSVDLFVPESLDRIANGIVAAIAAADQNLSTVKIAATKVTGPAIQRNRRSEFYTPTTSAPIDTDLIVWQLQKTSDSSVVATLFNFALHGTSLQPDNRLLSGDNAGWAMSQVENSYAGSDVALFINGSEGDIAPIATNPIAMLAAVEVGQTLGNAVITAAAGLSDWQTTGQMRSAVKHVTLPTTTHANTTSFLPDWLSMNLALGDSIETTAYFGGFFATWGTSSLSITTVPGEPITIVGNTIKSTALAKQATTNEYAMVGALGMGHMGYITDATQYDAGGYEAGGTLYGRETNTFIQSTTTTLQDCAILNTGC